MLRFPVTIATIQTQLSTMVHPCVGPDSIERAHHERFMLTRLAIGGGALSFVPAYLACRGTLNLFETSALIAVTLPLLAVFVLIRTGRLDVAHGLSVTGFTLFIATLSVGTGGASSPFLLWLAVAPGEATLFGRRTFVVRATLVSIIGLISVMLLDRAGLSQPAPVWLAYLLPLLATAGLITIALLAISWLRQHEAELQQLRNIEAGEQLRRYHLGDLVTWHDVTGGVVFANPTTRLAGLEPNDLIGRGLLGRVHVADRPLFLQALSDAAHGVGEASATIRIMLVAKDGERAPVVHWLKIDARRVTEEGSCNGAVVVCVMRDVSADQEKLRESTKAATISDEKRQFLATVSHELRTPLNAIIGFSEVLGDDVHGALDTAKRIEYAKIIHTSGHHLLDVVNTLLDVSKIESGAMAIEHEPVDLAVLVEDCCKLMTLRAELGRVQLERVLGPELPMARGDRRALKQIVLNLLSNAVKFIPAGGQVTLAVVRDGDMLDLSISDTGIGIAEKDLPRLGDPFFQAKASYDRDYEGTGLGLSVVRGLVGLHGGRLTVESAPGVGTRVSVRLPLAGAALDNQPARIVTFARAPRRGLDTKDPYRLTA